MVKNYMPGMMIKDVTNGTTSTKRLGLSNLPVKGKVGSKLKKLMDGSRPNSTNPGSRTKVNGKQGRRRAALLD